MFSDEEIAQAREDAEVLAQAAEVFRRWKPGLGSTIAVIADLERQLRNVTREGR